MPIGGKTAKKAPEEKAEEAQKVDEAKRQNAIAKMVEKSVIDQLGKPAGFVKIEAKSVGEDRFRVNVWAEGSIPGGLITGGWSGMRIVDSFYIHATQDGIISSSPEIKSKYGFGNKSQPVIPKKEVCKETLVVNPEGSGFSQPKTTA